MNYRFPRREKFLIIFERAPQEDFLRLLFLPLSEADSASSLQKRCPVRRMNTSSKVGLLTLNAWISPGNASTTSGTKR